MKFEEMKRKVKSFTDSAGFDIAGFHSGISTKEELREVIQNHIRWLETMQQEAQRSTEDLLKEIGLD